MSETLPKNRQAAFHRLKIIKKDCLTKNTFFLELEVPAMLKSVFKYEAGQYVRFRINNLERDFSITSAPFEDKLTFGIKINDADSASNFLFKNYQEGDFIEVSEPKGRFILPSKPQEFRTILGFASGIGITPILSHLKNILHNESRTRLFLFYGNRDFENTPFKKELEHLAEIYSERLKIFHFYSQEKNISPLFLGRIDRKKIKLIISQLLDLDETDEESTIWDAVDKVLICGKGPMIKEIANACYENGIPKKNIHFEFFGEFNDNIYPVKKDYPKVENIKVSFKINRYNYTTTIADNSGYLLQGLLAQKFPVPYSCKSGICGSCLCKLDEGKVEISENEFLTEKEAAEGKILACKAIALTEQVKLNFDLI